MPPGRWWRPVVLCPQPCCPACATSAATRRHHHSSCFGNRYRQRCNDVVALPGAFSHLGQQAQCNLPLFILPASAIASDAVMVLRCAVLSES